MHILKSNLFVESRAHSFGCDWSHHVFTSTPKYTCVYIYIYFFFYSVNVQLLLYALARLQDLLSVLCPVVKQSTPFTSPTVNKEKC
jgi:hypothetical protein